jgi:hypothetical protein
MIARAEQAGVEVVKVGWKGLTEADRRTRLRLGVLAAHQHRDQVDYVFAAEVRMIVPAPVRGHAGAASARRGGKKQIFGRQ